MKDEEEKKNEEFIFLIKTEFCFLEKDFNFKFEEIKKENHGIYIYYLTKKTAVRISLVARDGGLFVDLFKLKKGKVPEYPPKIYVNSNLNSYDFETLLRFRIPETKIERPPIDDLVFNTGYEKVFKRVLKQYASALKKYASDVLQGDFSVFKDLEKIVKSRIRKD